MKCQAKTSVSKRKTKGCKGCRYYRKVFWEKVWQWRCTYEQVLNISRAGKRRLRYRPAYGIGQGNKKKELEDGMDIQNDWRINIGIK